MNIAFREMQDTLRGLAKLNSYIRLPRRRLAMVLFWTFLAAGLEGIGIGLLMPVLELLRSDVPSQPTRVLQILMDWIPGKSNAYYAIVLCGAVLAAVVLKNLCLFLGGNATASLRAQALLKLRDAIFSRLQYASLSSFEKHTTGEMANAIHYEAGGTAYSIEFLTLFLQRTAMALCYLCVLVAISWQLSALTAILAILCGLALTKVFSLLAQSGHRLSETNERLAAHLMETLQGARLIRTSNTQQQEIERFHNLNLDSTAVHLRTFRATSLLTPITEVIGVLGAMTIVGTTAAMLVAPGHMKGEHLLGFAFVLLRMLPLVSQLYHLYGQTINLSGAISRTWDWLQLPLHPKRPFGALPFQAVKRSIQIVDLHYTYPNGTPALQGISFEVERGSVVAIVGGSGSGKSTLAALLLRLREPEAGTILVDGVNYWDFSPETWHRQTGIVEQEAFLFHGTLLDNIRYGIPDITEEAVADALRLANLSSMIEELPRGLHSVVGERGATLSGGQRQRMSIARALARNPNILILDEATSALDSISEAQVQVALENAQQGRTALVIAHRFSTIRNAHKIIVLENGRIAEQGTWEELEARRGAFSNLLAASQKALV